MPAYYWGLYPCEDDEVFASLKEWNDFIVNIDPISKISFNELKQKFDSEYKHNFNILKEIFEKEYLKRLINIDSQLLVEQLNYLREAFKLEKKRQNSLDNKLVQIIRQSSILTAIVAIIISIIVNNININLNTEYICIFLILGLFSISSILLLVASIFISIKNLKTRVYYRPSHNMILYSPHESLLNFQKEELLSLYDIVEENIKINDMKAKKVNKAYLMFARGLIFFILFSINWDYLYLLQSKRRIKKYSYRKSIRYYSY